MTFSDDDLKRLKDNLFNLEYQPNFPKLGLSPEKVVALLDRLEAAERAVIAYTKAGESSMPHDKLMGFLSAWHKACGRE